MKRCLNIGYPKKNVDLWFIILFFYFFFDVSILSPD